MFFNSHPHLFLLPSLFTVIVILEDRWTVLKCV